MCVCARMPVTLAASFLFTADLPIFFNVFVFVVVVAALIGMALYLLVEAVINASLLPRVCSLSLHFLLLFEINYPRYKNFAAFKCSLRCFDFKTIMR